MESKKNHIYQKTFFDLTPVESEGMNEVIFKNARQLRKDALLIAVTNKSYSSATSLLILSSEEVIKAILVLLHSESYSVYKISDARKFFFDHQIRHQLVQLIEMSAGFIESVEKYSTQKEVRLFKIKNDFWNGLINEVANVIISSLPTIQSSRRVKDLENFNTCKNNGLYVGYKDKLIVPQKEINETTYRETKDIVERIFRVYKILRILYHPCVRNRKDQKEIESIKNKMKDFIDDAMKDFSFKELNFK
jgi:AbiV family abortive infection protein